ncbi:MAG: NADH-quinone oxidoreductase subunit NuoE [Firmicutes bacterium]|nr:NADH-quinone oxidoreductase subunit NuoE [Bacillota bacterium]
MTEAEVRELIARHQTPNGRVSGILGEIQKKYRYLPEEALRLVARELGIPLTQVYGVATFYAAFSLEPKGEHLICVCHGTTCHVRGAKQLAERLEAELQIKQGETTKDGKFTLEAVRCLGCCSLAPVVSIDGKVFGRIRPEQIPEVVSAWRGGEQT